MVRVLALSVIVPLFEHSSGQTKRLSNWHLFFLRWVHSDKENDEILVGSESLYCVLVERYVYPQTVVSVFSPSKSN